MRSQDFSEKTKLNVKEKADFQCCRCQAKGVEVHHITPISTGGTNAIDNASPLCSKCHSDFGGNPEKRKEIRQMRDHWYKLVSLKHDYDHDKIGVGRIVESGVTATRLSEGVHADMRCSNCGTRVGLLIGSSQCPTCGSEFGRS